MRDLVEALQQIEKSPLPKDPNACLNSREPIADALPGGRVILQRIERLACRDLVFQSGRLEGQPDYYHHELLGDEGFKVSVKPLDEFGLPTGAVIHTSKGRIEFDW